MSWPDDGEPRFYVNTVVGYRVNPAARGVSRTRYEPIVCAVLDRAYAHRIVREFEAGRPGGRAPTGKHGTTITNEVAAAKADALCAELNAQEDAGLLTEPETDEVAA